MVIRVRAEVKVGSGSGLGPFISGRTGWPRTPALTESLTLTLAPS